MCDGETDASQPDNGQRFTSNLGSRQFFTFPFSFFHGGIGGADVPGQRHHEGNCLLGGTGGIPGRRIHDDNPLSRSGGTIDIVDPHTGSHYRFQPGLTFQDLFSEFSRAADDNTICRLECFPYFFWR